jgi:hypothetical protein
MKIQVTQENIDQGNSFSSECPVALACQDAGLAYVDVSYPASLPLEIQWGAEQPMQHAVAPRSVRRFVEAFDKGQPVKPFNFILKAE